jgi:hypothetical protein
MDHPWVLKIEHTARVCDNICHLGRCIDLTDGQMRMAEVIGLFHDIGRFEQYRRYRTFNDRQSANHATMGIDVINKNAVLDMLPADEKTIIIDAIRFHNAPALPKKKSAACKVFMRSIRDADKLDIWKVFADYFRHCQHPDPAIVQHLPDLPQWEERIVKAITEKRMARFKDMKSLNDFRLLQLSWVFDLHFPETFTFKPNKEAIWPRLPAHCPMTLFYAMPSVSFRIGWTKSVHLDRTQVMVFPR